MKSMFFTELVGKYANITVNATADDSASKTYSGRITHFVRETNDTDECFLELDGHLLISVRYIVTVDTNE